MDPQQDKVLFGQATTIVSTSFKNAIGVYDISPLWLSSPASLDNYITAWRMSAQTFSVSCDVDQKVLRFAPTIYQHNFRTVFTCAAGWGIYTQVADSVVEVRPSLTVLGGDLDGFTLEVSGHMWRIEGNRVCT